MLTSSSRLRGDVGCDSMLYQLSSEISMDDSWFLQRAVPFGGPGNIHKRERINPIRR